MSLSKEQMQERLRMNMHEQEGRRRANKIIDACPHRNETGELVRGVVSKVRCSKCGSKRWDDGTRCWSCKIYAKVLLDNEDDGRLA